MRVAVLFAQGFEEGEALTIVDILRRAQIDCDIVGESDSVVGAHNIVVKSDRLIDDIKVSDYEMVVLPGGRPGADNLRDNDTVIRLIKEMNKAQKWIGAMCAAPIALERAGVLENRNYTAYVGYDKVIKSGHFVEDIVVVDKNIVTSRGPATVYAFAYALVDVLGKDSLAVKKRMVYTNAFDVEEDKIYG